MKQKLLNNSPLLEGKQAMRHLMQRITLASGTQSVRILAFIAARSAEGTSTLAQEYATTIAQETAQKVLLIDATAHSLKKGNIVIPINNITRIKVL